MNETKKQNLHTGQNLKSELSLSNKARRSLWGIVNATLFRPSPRIAFGWRRFLLRTFGAKVGLRVRIYNDIRIFDPSNLVLCDDSVIGPRADLYSVGLIEVGQASIISQGSHLCGATHDFRRPDFPLLIGKISVRDGVWICADSFIGPNVTIGDRAVVGARSVVVKDVAEGSIVAGNPAREVGTRDL